MPVSPRRTPRLAAVLLAVLMAFSLAAAPAVGAKSTAQQAQLQGSGLSAHQRTVLYGIAKDTWAFYKHDLDPNTHLPLDNLGPGKVRGSYTSAANIGVYLWAVVAAHDLKLISAHNALSLIRATLRSVATLKRSKGFLYQWYDTANKHAILNPGDIDCSTETTPAQDNCYFLSAVDNGWYASGLLVTRQAFPQLAALADSLIKPMDFSIFYDNRPQTACNTNMSISGNQPTGQMYGGYYVDQGPAGYHNGALYSLSLIHI